MENNKIAKLTCLFLIFFNMLKNQLNPRIFFSNFLNMQFTGLKI